MSKELKIGMIGLDTSHCQAFAKLLNDASHPYHIPGGKVVSAWPGGSPDFDLSWSRLEKFTHQLRNECGVKIVDSIAAVAEQSDAILLTSVDGRIHLSQFEQIIAYGKPVFIDKPFAVSSSDARQMIALAEKHRVPLMSSSSLRYSEALVQALNQEEKGAILGAHVYGPMTYEPTQPGYYWYGIHAVETLFTVLGRGCKEVSVVSQEDYDLISGVWHDGRIGSTRGCRKGEFSFGALIHREEGTLFADLENQAKPNYAGLMEQVMAMFQSGRPGLELQETLEVIRFLEAANESKETGKPVSL